MAHRGILTRTELLKRYALHRCITLKEATALHGDDDVEEFRALVEAYERLIPPHFGVHAATTTVEGVTR